MTAVLSVGETVLDPPILLAPMAGITTPAMRTLCEEMGAALTFTEMVSVDGLVRRAERVRGLLAPSRHGRPFGVQLCGRKPDEMEQAAAMAADMGAWVIDVNMGCPARKVVKSGSGAALMRNLDLAARLVEAARRGAPRARVTVKMRIGWDTDRLNAEEAAAAVAQAGVAWVTVHGRTRDQGFSGPVDLDAIGRVVRSVAVPVVGNGDVRDAASMQRMFSETGCAGVMVGRAALGRPWVFRELAAEFRGRDVPPAASLEERRRIMARHLDLYLEEAKEGRAVLEMRKHLAWYSKSIRGAAAFRAALYKILEVDPLRAHIATLGRLA
jgi:nifR3 family TIM-barrel protein